MPLPQFISRLNWRLIIIHMVACWLFINAFKILSYLHDPGLLAFFRSHHFNQPDYKHPEICLREYRGIEPVRLSYFLLWAACAAALGLLAGSIISRLISIKKHWYWLNSIIVFATLVLLGIFKISAWKYLKIIFLTPGSIFKEFSIGYFLINGLVMLGAGLMLFFSPALTRFINSGWPEIEKKPILAKSPGPENEI